MILSPTIVVSSQYCPRSLVQACPHFATTLTQVGTLSVLDQKQVSLLLLLLDSDCPVLSVYYPDSLLLSSFLFPHFLSLGYQFCPSIPLNSPYYIAQIPALDTLCLTYYDHPNPTMIDLFALYLPPNYNKQPKLAL